MANKKKDNEKGVVSPVEVQTQPRSTFDTSIADAVQRKETELSRQKEERDRLQQDITSARNEKGSFLKNWLHQSKPTYDPLAEERARKATRIKAIGEALGLVASGYAAFGKDGAGYVPKFKSTAVEDIEKINEARKTYLEQNKEWQDFYATQRMADITAREEAAKALLDAKDKEIADTEDAIEKYKEDIYRHLSNKEIAELKATQALEKQEERHAQSMKEIGARASAAQSKKDNEEELLRYAAIADLISPPQNVSETVVNEGEYDEKRTTRTSTARLSRAESLKRGEAFKNSWEGRVYDILKDSGYTDEDYLQALPILEKTIEDLVKNEGYSYDRAIEEVINYMRNE